MDRTGRSLVVLVLALTVLTVMALSGTAVGESTAKEVLVVNGAGSSVPVAGTVNVGNFPETQEVSGTVGIDPSANTVQVAGGTVEVQDGRVPWQVIVQGQLRDGISGQCFSVPDLPRGGTIVLEQATLSTSPSDPGGLRMTVGGHYNAGSSFLVADVASLVTSAGMRFDTQEIQAILTPGNLVSDAPSNRLLNLSYCASRSDTSGTVSFDLTIAGYELVS